MGIFFLALHLVSTSLLFYLSFVSPCIFGLLPSLVFFVPFPPSLPSRWVCFPEGLPTEGQSLPLFLSLLILFPLFHFVSAYLWQQLVQTERRRGPVRGCRWRKKTEQNSVFCIFYKSAQLFSLSLPVGSGLAAHFPISGPLLASSTRALHLSQHTS